MNYMTGIKTPTLLLAALLLVAGCSSYPEQEREDARLALVSADSLEADVYAPEMYLAAADSFTVAELVLDAQKGQAPGDRTFDDARRMLKFAKATADEAAVVASDKREEVRLEAEALIAEAGQLIAAAPPVSADVALVGSHASPSSQLHDARVAYESGNFLQARDLASSLVASLKAVPSADAQPADQS
jgi:hypothetical protein